MMEQQHRVAEGPAGSGRAALLVCCVGCVCWELGVVGRWPIARTARRPLSARMRIRPGAANFARAALEPDDQRRAPEASGTTNKYHVAVPTPRPPFAFCLLTISIFFPSTLTFVSFVSVVAPRRLPFACPFCFLAPPEALPRTASSCLPSGTQAGQDPLEPGRSPHRRSQITARVYTTRRAQHLPAWCCPSTCSCTS